MNKEIFRTAPWPIKVAFMIIGGALYLFVISYLIYLLWNNVLVKVTSVKMVSYWQAMGILALFKILFGFRMFGGKGKRKRDRKERWQNKWSGMSQEDKVQAKARWKAYCDSKHKTDQ